MQMSLWPSQGPCIQARDPGCRACDNHVRHQIWGASGSTSSLLPQQQNIPNNREPIIFWPVWLCTAPSALAAQYSAVYILECYFMLPHFAEVKTGPRLAASRPTCVRSITSSSRIISSRGGPGCAAGASVASQQE